jgi:hypothetical protein
VGSITLMALSAQLTNRVVVIDDRAIAARGPGTTVDFSLGLTGLLAGKPKLDQVQPG